MYSLTKEFKLHNPTVFHFSELQYFQYPWRLGRKPLVRRDLLKVVPLQAMEALEGEDI
jgi:hypothetical protein